MAHFQMRNKKNFQIFLMFLLGLHGCSDTLPTPSEQAWQPDDTTLGEHFVYVMIGFVPAPKMHEVATTLNEHRIRIMRNQGVSNLPRVTVKVWGDRDSFEQAFLTHEHGNARFVAGYVDAENWEVRVFNFDRPIGLTAVHEFAHLVSIAVNPSIDNNPRWLWEAIAIYESARPPVPDVSDLKCFGPSSSPTLQDLNRHPMNIYRVGYYLTKFIVDSWGMEGVAQLIESNGDLPASLGVSEQQFENLWFQSMRVDEISQSDSDC